MSFSKSYINNTRYDFKFSSCFSYVMEYAGFAVVGELGSDGALLPWFLLLMIVCLPPLAILLSQALGGLAVSIFSVLQACVSVLLGFPFSPMLCKELVLQEVSGDGVSPVADLARVKYPTGCYFSNILLLLDFKCSANAGS